MIQSNNSVFFQALQLIMLLLQYPLTTLTNTSLTHPFWKLSTVLFEHVVVPVRTWIENQIDTDTPIRCCCLHVAVILPFLLAYFIWIVAIYQHQLLSIPRLIHGVDNCACASRKESFLLCSRTHFLYRKLWISTNERRCGTPTWRDSNGCYEKVTLSRRVYSLYFRYNNISCAENARKLFSPIQLYNIYSYTL